MASLERFKSKTGILSASAQEVYNFISDIRNFEKFVPREKISDWKADRESCRFSVTSLGSMELKITAREPFNRVVFSGTALSANKFDIILTISEKEWPVKVDIVFEAELNPVLKMMISGPLNQLLDKIINEMEEFREWSNIIEDNPLP